MRIAYAGFAGFVAGYVIMMFVAADVKLSTAAAVIVASVFLTEAAVLNKLDEMDERLSKK
jgi:hypothetical protein